MKKLELTVIHDFEKRISHKENLVSVKIHKLKRPFLVKASKAVGNSI
jgi:hypothetical protein